MPNPAEENGWYLVNRVNWVSGPWYSRSYAKIDYEKYHSGSNLVPAYWNGKEWTNV